MLTSGQYTTRCAAVAPSSCLGISASDATTGQPAAGRPAGGQLKGRQLKPRLQTLSRAAELRGFAVSVLLDVVYGKHTRATNATLLTIYLLRRALGKPIRAAQLRVRQVRGCRTISRLPRMRNTRHSGGFTSDYIGDHATNATDFAPSQPGGVSRAFRFFAKRDYRSTLRPWSISDI